MAKQGFRMKFMFWLDTTKPDEDQLIDQVEQLKQERLFSRTLRDGIRLICDLRKGNVDVLLELFPWVRDALQTAPVTTTEQLLQAQLTRLEALMLTQGTASVPQRHTRQPELPAQTALMSPARENSHTIAQNFVQSMKGFASGLFD